jgi:endonuclease III
MEGQVVHPVSTRKILKQIEEQLKQCVVPWVTIVSRRREPYKVLVSCVLSLRTQDKTTAGASQRLFAVSDTPAKMARLSQKRLERLIYPVGFYRNKARHLIELSQQILQEFSGKVPAQRDALMSLKGVGRKTANLVLGLGYGIPAICVDTHVHRISNRLGWVKTRHPHETEAALEVFVPRAWWIRLNTIFVSFGQNICVPISPWCSRCKVRSACRRCGVSRWR